MRWMRWLFCVFMLLVVNLSTALASETVYDIYGKVSKIESWPEYNGTAFQGYLKTITVNGQAYPLAAKLKVSRRVNPPAMYPVEVARFSDVQPGKYVDLRLSGHMVFEIVIER